jgi:chorismate synthase
MSIRFLTAGESHGRGLVCIIEGLPANLEISSEYINRELERRQRGYGRGGRMKIEKDRVQILSGVRFGKTIGSPIALFIENRDWENWKEDGGGGRKTGERSSLYKTKTGACRPCRWYKV